MTVLGIRIAIDLLLVFGAMAMLVYLTRNGSNPISAGAWWTMVGLIGLALASTTLSFLGYIFV